MHYFFEGLNNIAATVPGGIYTDLLRAGHIDDPYYRDNDHEDSWIARTNWVYSKNFTGNALKFSFLNCLTMPMLKRQDYRFWNYNHPMQDMNFDTS